MKYTKIVCLLSAMFGYAATGWAQPSLLNHQGRLVDASGDPISGLLSIEVRLFDTESDDVALWQQTINNVEAINGLYHFQFGDAQIAGVLEEEQLWLELVIDSELLSPRQQLVSVPYALRAKQLVDAGNIDGGTLVVDRVPDLPASKITSGTFDIGLIPDIPAEKIVSGTLSMDRLPSDPTFAGTVSATSAYRVNAAGRSTFITGDSSPHIYSSSDTFEGASGNHGALILQSRSTAERPIRFVTGSTPTERMRVGSGGVNVGGNVVINSSGNIASADRIPNLPASKTTSGSFHVDRIPNLPASKITSGTLPVSRGGTGRSSFNAGRVLVGNGGSALNSRVDLKINSGAGFWGDSLRTPVLRAGGVQGKRGVNSTSWGQPFNFWWDGSGAELWVDNVNLGYFLSDRRLKTDLAPPPANAIERVLALAPTQYRYKHIEGSIFSGSDEVLEGFIADEVQAVIPSAVKGKVDELTADGQIQPQQLKAIPLIALLTQAIQEQQATIEKLEARLAVLESQ